MKNKIINRATLAQIASALKELKNQMIFVGGAVVILYVEDEPVEEVRQTDDVDVTINLVNYAAWVQMQERLTELGFSPDPKGHAICSYLYNGISIDIMPSEDGPIGPANKWYKVGFENLWTKEVEGQLIRILSAPCFLATKFEDIIYVLDNRTTLINELQKEPDNIKKFLKDEFIKVYTKSNFEEIIFCHIDPSIYADRFPIIKEKIEHIIAI
jgi:hypothetical protein